MAIARKREPGKNFSGKYLWVRGCAISTVRFELEQVRKYIHEQEIADVSVSVGGVRNLARRVNAGKE
jgi:putative transposase